MKLFTPYDLGNYIVKEDCHKLNINDLINKLRSELKTLLIQSQVDVLGTNVTLTTSKTKFDGKRIWFSCPKCFKRVGVLFKHPFTENVGCRQCLSLKYKKQRFKGMIESSSK